MPKYIRDVFLLCLTEGLSVRDADHRAWGTMTDEGNFESLILKMAPLDFTVLVGLVRASRFSPPRAASGLAARCPVATYPVPRLFRLR